MCERDSIHVDSLIDSNIYFIFLYVAGSKRGLVGTAFGDEEIDEKTKYVPLWKQEVIVHLLYLKNSAIIARSLLYILFNDGIGHR